MPSGTPWDSNGTPPDGFCELLLEDGRSRGTLIALMLLLLFLTLATWWVYRSAERIVEQRRPVEATHPATQRLP